MDSSRVLLAIVLSVAIIIGWQYFFVGSSPTPPSAKQDAGRAQTLGTAQQASQTASPPTVTAPAASPAASAAVPSTPPKPGRDI
ncbi:MAG TPA: hypothetical protein DEB25_09480, partial [Desulfobulbaceae bacterium]|nr:hypothetical protein [Desulfobulbaceae bacterium]